MGPYIPAVLLSRLPLSVLKWLSLRCRAQKELSQEQWLHAYHRTVIKEIERRKGTVTKLVVDFNEAHGGREAITKAMDFLKSRGYLITMEGYLKTKNPENWKLQRGKWIEVDENNKEVKHHDSNSVTVFKIVQCDPEHDGRPRKSYKGLKKTKVK